MSIHAKVKQYADAGDIRSLKYWFKGSLDGDPTFHEFEDDYAYCKENCPELFEPYQELTPLSLSNVDEVYWVQLQEDLLKNFSEERFQHMREAAKIFYHQRIKSIDTAEKAKKAEKAEPVPSQSTSEDKQMQERMEIARQQRLLAEEKRRQYEAKKAAAVSRPVPQQPETHHQENPQSKKATGLGQIIMVAAIILLILIIIIKHKNS